MVKRIAPRRPSAAAENAEETPLQNAANVLFGTKDHPLTLRDGTQVVVAQAKTRHVGLLLGFFNAVLRALDKRQLIQLIEMIEDRNRKVASKEVAPEEEDSIDILVDKAFGKSELVLTLFHSVYEVLPGIVAALTEMPEEKFLDLDIDEGMSVTYTVFAVNYAFFSQNLPLAMRGFLALAAQKIGGK